MAIGFLSPTTYTAGLTFIGATAFSATTTVNINNCFSSTYINYRILITPTLGTGTTGGNVFWYSRNGGTTDTSSVYSASGCFVTGTGSPTGLSDENVSGGFIGRGAISTGWGEISMDVHQPFETEYTTVLAHSSGVTGSNDAWVNVSSKRRTAASHDGIAFTFPNNTTGTIYIYGYQKA